MAVLPQLIDAQRYRPCDWDLQQDADGLKYWINVFCEHLGFLLEVIAAEYPDAGAERIGAFRQDYLDTMGMVAREPERFARVDILFLTELRRDVQDRHGFHDPFHGVKQRENDAALALLPGRLAEIESLPAEGRLDALIDGLMAGNMFDLGAMAIVDRYRSREAGLRDIHVGHGERSCLIDDRDAFRKRWLAQSSYRHVLFFVDNSGTDVCLGCIPLALWMLRAGARVTLAANSGPALNDVTSIELSDIVETIGDRGLIGPSTQRMSVTGSGCTTPLIDLISVPNTFASAVHDADLIILHGMGRAIESNAAARFRCDVLRTATLKDPAVARRLGGRVFDGVFRFTPAPAG